MYVLHHILDAMNFYKNPFLVNFFPVNFEFTVKGFNCIDISHLFSFLSRYYTLSTTVQRPLISVRISGLFRKGLSVRQYCFRLGQTPQLSRAREITEQLYEIFGPGNSGILRDSGHRVYPGRAQNNTIQLYLLSGKDGIHRDYHYVILQSRNMNFKYLCFNFGPFLTEVTTLTSTFLRDYKWE